VELIAAKAGISPEAATAVFAADAALIVDRQMEQIAAERFDS
jgi:hypothetical protein